MKPNDQYFQPGESFYAICFRRVEEIKLCVNAVAKSSTGKKVNTL